MELSPILFSLGSLFFIGFYFFLEQRSLQRSLRRIRFRIAVTGTRGKSTVTRLIAAALREAGYFVLAKTTGSKPVLILPDGREEEIKRRGRPSILEVKRIVKQGVRLGVDAIVIETMSIQPEYLRVESQRLVQPHVLVITNIRLDHREEQGRTKEEIATSLASAIAKKAIIFIPEEELRPEFSRVAAKMKAKLIGVPKNLLGSSPGPSPNLPSLFEENIRLALATSDSLGISSEIAWRGMRKAQSDFGSLKVWQAEFGSPPKPWTLVSAFAANEPESTAIILNHLKDKVVPAAPKMVGILNFRQDRGDRSLQWLEAMEKGFLSEFDRIYVIGAHTHSLKLKKLAKGNSRLGPLALDSPRAIMEKVVLEESAGGLLIGMGNMGGLGAELVQLWEKKGVPYGC
ncbi:MAG: poly-gamma-glutamate synthase PgsB [Candidatus Aminicenantales bacterium]